jgi:hypothetical protein
VDLPPLGDVYGHRLLGCAASFGYQAHRQQHSGAVHLQRPDVHSGCVIALTRVIEVRQGAGNVSEVGVQAPEVLLDIAGQQCGSHRVEQVLCA